MHKLIHLYLGICPFGAILWICAFALSGGICVFLFAKRATNPRAHLSIPLQALHERSPPVAHRDIKASNAMITQDWRAKLGDFDLAIEVHWLFPGLCFFCALHFGGCVVRL